MADYGSNTDRRAFLKSVGAGLGLGVIDGRDLQQVGDIEYDPSKEVAYIAGWENVEGGKPGEREPFYNKIGREDFERRWSTFDVKEQIDEKLSQYDEASVAFEQMEDSPTGFGVAVYMPELGSTENDREEIEKLVPAETGGGFKFENDRFERSRVPVKVETQNRKLTSCSSTNFDYIPGGASLEVPSKQNETGTLAAAFYSNEYGGGWVTAGHVVKDIGGSVGNEIHQDAGEVTDPFGVARQAHFDLADLDYAFIEPTSSESTSGFITGSDGSTKEYGLRGIVSDAELVNNVGNESFELLGHGRTTCQSSGYITGVQGSGTTSVTTTTGVQPGDSGGPLFKVEDGEAYIAGIRFMDVDDGARSKSTTANTVENKLNGFFAGNS
ncbi:trypsin-like peptidase domain-containing protein [Candidatus Nanohalococcus occultus]|uniref:Serine protease n=1 Tax=Candidatus Nanohalococcus occultus TaxID=2978047 RepID=A0ABY8CF41_9ARCH|nr:Serine protease [Candidatus Nanohaloarchaeota archaeon SVXNc]